MILRKLSSWDFPWGRLFTPHLTLSFNVPWVEWVFHGLFPWKTSGVSMNLWHIRWVLRNLHHLGWLKPYGIYHLSTGAVFLPSAVCWKLIHKPLFWGYSRQVTIWNPPFEENCLSESRELIYVDSHGDFPVELVFHVVDQWLVGGLVAINLAFSH